MNDLIRLFHNVLLLIYHFACPAKYRRVIFDEAVDTDYVKFAKKENHDIL